LPRKESHDHRSTPDTRQSLKLMSAIRQHLLQVHSEVALHRKHCMSGGAGRYPMPLIEGLYQHHQHQLQTPHQHQAGYVLPFQQTHYGASYPHHPYHPYHYPLSSSSQNVPYQAVSASTAASSPSVQNVYASAQNIWTVERHHPSLLNHDDTNTAVS